MNAGPAVALRTPGSISSSPNRLIFGVVTEIEKLLRSGIDTDDRPLRLADPLFATSTLVQRSFGQWGKTLAYRDLDYAVVIPSFTREGVNVMFGFQV